MSKRKYIQELIELFKIWKTKEYITPEQEKYLANNEISHELIDDIKYYINQYEQGPFEKKTMKKYINQEFLRIKNDEEKKEDNPLSDEEVEDNPLSDEKDNEEKYSGKSYLLSNIPKLKGNRLLPLIIAPISHDIKKKSNIDFQEQLNREKNSIMMCWDDSRANNAKDNDLFAFYFPPAKENPKPRFELFKIDKVLSTKERLKSWENNVNQQNRNRLNLIRLNITIGYNEWKKMEGPTSRNCTYQLTAKKFNTFYINLYRHILNI